MLLEADLDSELSKLDVYGKTIDGLKDFLKHLLLDPNTGKAGLRFLYVNLGLERRSL